MPVIAPHLSPQNKTDCFDTWKKRGRLVKCDRYGTVQILRCHKGRCILLD